MRIVRYGIQACFRWHFKHATALLARGGGRSTKDNPVRWMAEFDESSAELDGHPQAITLKHGDKAAELSAFPCSPTLTPGIRLSTAPRHHDTGLRPSTIRDATEHD